MRARSRVLTFAAAIAAACGRGPAPPAAVHEAIVDAIAAPAEPTRVTVQVAVAGHDVDAVEREVSVPIERALAGIAGVARTRSVSRAGAASVTLTLAPDARPDAVRSAVHEQLAALRGALPTDANPEILADTAAPARRFVVTGELDARTLRSVARRVADQLASAPGVARVELCGGREAAVTIAVDPARLAARGLAVGAVIRGVAAVHPDGATGLHARVVGPGIEDLARAAIAPGVVVGDVATVALDGVAPDCDAAEVGGGPALLGTVWPRRGVAEDELAAALGERLAAAQASSPAGVRVESPARTRVVLAGTAGAEPETTVARAAGQLAAALADARRAGPVYVQASAPAVVGAPVELELLLTRAEPAALAAALATVPGLRVRSLGDDEATRATAIVTSDDLEVAARVAGELAALARELPDVLDAEALWAMTPEQVIEPDRARLAAAGLAVADVTQTLAAALAGVTVGRVLQGDAQVPVRVRLGEASLADPATLAALRLITPTGAIALSDVATFRVAAQPAAITRIDRQRAVEVALRLADAAAAREALASAAAADLRLPPGCTVRFE